MADRYEQFGFIAAAGNGSNAYSVGQCQFNPGIVTQVDVTIPTGADGIMGFQVWSGESPVVPFQQGSFLLRSGGTWSFPVGNQPASGSWQLAFYNTDYVGHGIWALFYVNEVGLAVSAPSSPLPVTV